MAFFGSRAPFERRPIPSATHKQEAKIKMGLRAPERNPFLRGGNIAKEMRALGKGSLLPKQCFWEAAPHVDLPPKATPGRLPLTNPSSQAGRQLSRLARVFANTRPLSARRPKCRVTCPRRGREGGGLKQPRPPASRPPLPFGQAERTPPLSSVTRSPASSRPQPHSPSSG